MSLHSTKQASIELKNIAGERTKARGGGENLAEGNFVAGPGNTLHKENFIRHYIKINEIVANYWVRTYQWTMDC